MTVYSNECILKHGHEKTNKSIKLKKTKTTVIDLFVHAPNKKSKINSFTSIQD